MTPNPTTTAPTTEEWMTDAAKEAACVYRSPTPTSLYADTITAIIARHYAAAHPAGTETERAKQLAGALAEIKDRVRVDEDFSADEIVEFIDKFIGKFSIGPAWAISAAAKEEITELKFALAEAKARCAELEKRLQFVEGRDAETLQACQQWIAQCNAAVARAETAEAQRDRMKAALESVGPHLKQMRNTPAQWKSGGAGGQDKYAGLPPAMRLLDVCLKEITAALAHPTRGGEAVSNWIVRCANPRCRHVCNENDWVMKPKKKPTSADITLNTKTAHCPKCDCVSLYKATPKDIVKAGSKTEEEELHAWQTRYGDNAE